MYLFFFHIAWKRRRSNNTNQIGHMLLIKKLRNLFFFFLFFFFFSALNWKCKRNEWRRFYLPAIPMGGSRRHGINRKHRINCHQSSQCDKCLERPPFDSRHPTQQQKTPTVNSISAIHFQSQSRTNCRLINDGSRRPSWMLTTTSTTMTTDKKIVNFTPTVRMQDYSREWRRSR